MKIVIAGASGFVGSSLVDALRAQGHDVFRLARSAPRVVDEISWDPANRQIDSAKFHGTEAVISLSGENVGAGRWTAARRERIRRSRVDATRTLVTAMAALPRKPAVFLSASAVGAYGDRGEEILTEASPLGHGFLPEVCLEWETHAEGAARAGIRTALLRFGVILGPDGGALARMLPVFRLGLGGRLGTGRQWFSWIAMADVIGAVQKLLADPRCAGPFNIVAPNPVTNAEFTAALSQVLQRPANLPVPAWTLRLLLGRMADEALLASTRAVPKNLLAAGYSFRFPNVRDALAASISTKKV